MPILFFIIVLFMQSCNSDTSANTATSDDEIGKKVEALLGKMTLEEKVGQMNQYNGFWDVTGPVPEEGNAKTKYDHLKKGLVGAVLNVKGYENVYELQKLVVEESRLGIPLLFGYDVIHGHKTLFPIPLAESSSWDLKAIEKGARIAAIEASALGINWTFAPMVDISRDARWGRVMEGAGEDPYLGSKIGVARVNGFQGDDLSANNTIAACAKHFAGYGFGEGGLDYNTVDIGTSTLYNVVFPPFKAAIEEGKVRTVMNSFNLLNGVPATGNEWLQRDILKEGWGFQGFVVSDWASGMEMTMHGYSEDLKEAAERAANAGSDMDMESYSYVTHLADLVKDGKVEEAKIDDAVRRILRVKFELGLFDDPYRYCSEERQKELIYHEDHLAAALDMAKRSMVLLKNEGNLLPLDKDQKGIAVIGALANDKNSPLGSWRIGSDDNSAVSVVEGLKEYTENFQYTEGAKVIEGYVSFGSEAKVNETDKSGFAEAVNLARKSEVVVMVLGEHGFQSGEARSRSELGLPGVQQELLEAVYAVNKNIVLVLMNGRPLTITWADEHIPAILEAWQLGTQTGHAVSKVLFGDYNPSGKLPMTFPRSVGQIPIYYNHYNTGRPRPKATEVFYSHYIDETKKPLYPFGYGLSYTTFKYEDLNVAVNGRTVNVSVKVTNTGSRKGEEVAQLYIHDRAASLTRPLKELKGFEKFELEAGDSKIVEFTLTEKELGFYDTKGTYIVEPGMFGVMVGGQSDKGLDAEFELK